MDQRTQILEAATELLAGAPEADVSIREVCEAAGIRAPALYRHFDDKDALLAAVVDHGFEQYLASKRAARPSADPVADLRSGWDNHVRFALEHPNHYRLMWSPALSVPPAAAKEAHDLLLEVLERCAAAGRLRVDPGLAAQMVMSANAGVALSMITRPAIYTDPDASRRLRDAVIDAVTVGDGDAAGAATDDDEDRASAVLAAALGAVLRRTAPARLTGAELALLQQWLAQLAGASPPGSPETRRRQA